MLLNRAILTSLFLLAFGTTFMRVEAMLSPRSLEIQKHYETAFGSTATAIKFDKGPVHQLPNDFCVFEVPPGSKSKVWIYATCGMSFGDSKPIEVFLISPKKAPELVELFYAIAHFHLTGEHLDSGHTVNFGRPWLPGSRCDYGILSTMEGAKVQWANIEKKKVHFLWLIPITKAEREYKIKFGVDALDKKFVEKDVDCEDPLRQSAI